MARVRLILPLIAVFATIAVSARAEEGDVGQTVSTCDASAPEDSLASLSRALGGVYPAGNCDGADKVLPPKIVKWLGSKMMRQHHYLWHLVRTQWAKLPAAKQAQLEKQGWKPPRQQGTAGSGLDFICMHHEMIQDVNKHLKKAGNACYKEVEGWNPIPWDHKDPNWPMPSDEGSGDPSKSQSTTDSYHRKVDSMYSQDAWLSNKSLDDVGREFETGIHGWMHMHWATENGPADPMKCGATNADGCDWLGTPFTSHVNPAFWKLHGWIEARAQRWAELHNTNLDAACKDGWSGPKGMHMGGTRGMPGMPGMDGAGEGLDFNDFVNDLPDSMSPAGLRF